MKKILQGLESKNYFQKGLAYEKAIIRKGLKSNRIQKQDARRTRKEKRNERLLFLEYERKKILQKQDFFKNERKAINFLVNNTKNSNLSQDLQAIKYYNIRKEKAKKQAFKLLSSLI